MAQRRKRYLARTAHGAFRSINKRYFGGKIKVAAIEECARPVGNDLFVPKKEYGSTVNNGDGTFSIYVRSGLRKIPELLNLVMAHEMIHVKHPEADHGDKTWRKEVRRLQREGFFDAIFD